MFIFWLWLLSRAGGIARDKIGNRPGHAIAGQARQETVCVRRVDIGNTQVDVRKSGNSRS